MGITERIDRITLLTGAYRSLTPVPKSVKIELSARCDYRCFFCASSQRPERVQQCMQAGLDSLKFSFNFADPVQFKDVTQMCRRRLFSSASRAKGGSTPRSRAATTPAGAPIAERIRNKLAHFGVPPRLQREHALAACMIVTRLLARGIAPGGVDRTWHLLRSLPLARPGLWHLAVNDWIAALAMRDYVERHLGQVAR